jgi:hypothetical protein
VAFEADEVQALPLQVRMAYSHPLEDTATNTDESCPYKRLCREDSSEKERKLLLLPVTPQRNHTLVFLDLSLDTNGS